MMFKEKHIVTREDLTIMHECDCGSVEQYIFDNEQFPDAKFSCIDCDTKFVVTDSVWVGGHTWEVSVIFA